MDKKFKMLTWASVFSLFAGTTEGMPNPTGDPSQLPQNTVRGSVAPYSQKKAEEKKVLGLWKKTT